jgi:hypothetical protein
MNDERVRRLWHERRAAAERTRTAAKQSQAVLFDLYETYRALPDDERYIVNRLLADELASGDEAARFDALAVIDEFQIASALPALRKLAAWLEQRPEPGAPYERAQVLRIIRRLDPSASG